MINLNKFISVTNEKKHQCPLTLILLKEWSFITASGIDAAKYLQTQLTADIMKLSQEEHLLTAHCDPSGKMWSTLRLFHYKKGFGYILRSSVAEKQLRELKKYAVFSQITLERNSNLVLIGIIGQGASDTLMDYFSELSDWKKAVIHFNQTTLLHFTRPFERFLMITDNITATKLAKKILKYGQSQQWLALDIASGIPSIDIENTKKFIPQAVNLQELPFAISFKKGCYTGQEIIAKAKYLGINKRAMFWLQGTSKILPKSGDPIEWKVSNNWRRTGTVLASADLGKDLISIQVILKNDILKESVFRIVGEEESKLTIQPLPYLSKKLTE